MENLTKILLISDLHLHLQNIEDLAWNIFNQKLDFIFILGDFCNIEDGLQNSSNENIIKQFQFDMSQMLEIIINKYGVNKEKIFLIPGNHDHQILFQMDQICQVKNIHKNCLQIEEDLFLVGLGGSIDAFFIKEKHLAWKGFPYHEEKQMQSDLDEAIKNLPENSQFILMTHCGPLGSKTSQQVYQKLWVDSGSQTLRKFIQTNKDKILFNCHGHSHMGQRRFLLNNVEILNPGSLKYNKSYQIVEIVKKQIWELKQVVSKTIKVQKLKQNNKLFIYESSNVFTCLKSFQISKQFNQFLFSQESQIKNNACKFLIRKFSV